MNKPFTGYTKFIGIKCGDGRIKMNQAVIVFSFPEPEDPATVGLIIESAKSLFEGIDKVKVFMAINEFADTIISIIDPIDKPESNLVKHARRELNLAGNDEHFNTSIIKAVGAFASYVHSGGSASVAIPMLYTLLLQKNLTPLTDNPQEWNQHEEDIWQSRRNSEAFSKDGGKTYFLLSEDGKNGNPRPMYISTKHEENAQ